MVFPKNKLRLTHKSGAEITFSPFEALKAVRNGKMDLQVSCAAEWQETRPQQLLEEKLKPFDWTFTTDYQGTINDKIRTENSDNKLDIFKLMKKEKIFFYHDLTLFEDELHDNGIASCSVKIVRSFNFIFSLRFIFIFFYFFCP